MPTITRTDIIHEAVEIKAYIETNKKLPRYCTIKGNQYSVYTTSYLITRAISNLKAENIKVEAL